MEGPKETTRVEPRRWPGIWVVRDGKGWRAEAKRERSGEKERAKWKRDGTENGWDEGLALTGAGERGSQHWGLLIKVGLLDPLMKVQARGLLSALLP